LITQKKGKALRKQSLHGKTAASVFIEAVYQWLQMKDATPMTPPYD